LIWKNRCFASSASRRPAAPAAPAEPAYAAKAPTPQRMQDKLTGALIGLARSVDGSGETPSAETDRAMLAGLFTTITNVNFNNETINEMIDRVHAQRDSLVPGWRRVLRSLRQRRGLRHAAGMDRQRGHPFP
jgi:hydroxylamine reductase